MVFSNNNLYEQSDSLAFSAQSTGLDPYLMRGKRSLLRPSLPYIAEILMMGRSPLDLKPDYMVGESELMAMWDLNVKRLQGTDIDAQGSPGMINVLPANNFNYTMYEDEVPEMVRILKGTTAATYSANVITIYINTTSVNGIRPIHNLFVDDLLFNASDNGPSVLARITSVDTANDKITVEHFSGGSTFTALTDFVTADTAADQLHLAGSAHDFRNGVLPSAVRARDFRNASTVKTYQLQKFQDVWENSIVFDGKRRPFGDRDRPAAYENKQLCAYGHLRKISSSLLWSQATEVTAASDRQSFAGINSSISSNSLALADGFLSLADIDQILIDYLGGTHSSNLLYAFCSIPTLRIIESLFNSLGAGGEALYKKYATGMYSMEISVIKYRGREVHFIPVADFMDGSDRSFPDQATAVNSTSANIFFVDPQAVNLVVGSHDKYGDILFHEQNNVEDPEEKFDLERHALRTFLGFSLRHEKTSAKITNVQRADLLA